ncbi:hypothetical protein NMG60_11023264 [Bertholletia excelsa]
MNPSSEADCEEDEILPLTGKPYFSFFISKSHVKSPYIVTLPARMHPLLPSGVVPVVLTCRGKEWEMVYHGEPERTNKRFDASWKTFAADNNLKVGDACLLELLECSNSGVKFRVQILRGDFPYELMASISGETPDAPIIIE